MTLYRAIVSLPESMCSREHPLEERFVFFEAGYDDKMSRLEGLLSMAWDIDANGWTERGWIYNITSEYERFSGESFGEPETGDLRLIDTGCGEGRVYYADPARIDLFVSPRVRARLDAAIARIPAGGAA